MEDDDRVVLWPLGLAVGLAVFVIVIDAFIDDLLAALLWIVGEPTLGIGFCCGLALNLWHWRWRRAVSFAGVIGLYFALGALAGGNHVEAWISNWLRFLVMYPAYATDAPSRTPAPDGLIRYLWRGYGFAGMENDDYLVFDRTGRFSAKQRRAHPDGDFGLTCEIVATQPMVGRWVIVTTFNCDLDQS